MEQNNYSRKISERQWNQPDKGELESRRETTYIDDIIQKNHIERKLLEHLDGIETVFDGGAGSGRFSILLAKQGLQVTHFDISQPMIDKAKEILATTKYRIIDVAMQVGYVNSSSFTRAFREVEGITPNQYRKKAKENIPGTNGIMNNETMEKE